MAVCEITEPFCSTFAFICMPVPLCSLLRISSSTQCGITSALSALFLASVGNCYKTKLGFSGQHLALKS
jgi:hypothetical protein